MSEQTPGLPWRAAGASVRGAAHLRSGLPNQDAFCWFPAGGAGPPLMLALADGHGSRKSFRSEVGARLAVEAVQVVCHDFLSSWTELANLSAVSRWSADHLPRAIVRRWRDAVADDLAARPFASEELDALADDEGPERRRQVVLDPVLAYGSTLLAAIVAGSFITYLQLGDGDILAVSDGGEVTRPLPRDERLFANETTSLCARNAWRHCRVVFQPLFGPPPALILLATDGYANSFRDDEGFLLVGTDLLEMIRTQGLDRVHAGLEQWLREASQLGSGDDVTVGLLCREETAASAVGHQPPADAAAVVAGDE